MGRTGGEILGTSGGGSLPHKLRANQVTLLQSVVIGMATSAPGQSTAVTLAGMVAVTAYATGPAILIGMLPMLAIALSYQRLNMWDQNCGGPYVWVGKSISPYLGFQIAWFMLAGYVLGAVSDIFPLGPSLLSAIGIPATSILGNVLTIVLCGGAFTWVAAVGIRITARFQLTMAAIEYMILIAFCVMAFIDVFVSHNPGTVHPTLGWLGLDGVGGKGSLVAGLLVSIYLFTGWDASIYINEETEKKESNPGKAVLISVAILGPFFAIMFWLFQGVVGFKALEAHAASALPYIGVVLAGPAWGKLMAVAVVLSVIGTTQACIVCAARISYGMGTDGILPRFFASLHPRHQTPYRPALLWGGITIVVACLYVVSVSLASAFGYVVDTVGILFTLFYLFTGVATTWYYRRILFRSVADFFLVGVLPLGGAVMLGWIFEQSVTTFTGVGLWVLLGIFALGFVFMGYSLFGQRAAFWHIQHETFNPEGK
jgi:amino acid transporter